MTEQTHAALVAHQDARQMPPIEVGDWVAENWGDPACVETVVAYGSTRVRVYLRERCGYLTKREVYEIRKANGHVWRRDAE